MLAESTLNMDITYNPDVRSRSKRLKDIKKGVDYCKKLDNLAESQWKSNVPHFPAVNRRLSTLQTVTTSVLSEPEENYRRSTLMNMTSTPRQSFSMMSADNALVSNYSTVTPNGQFSLPNVSRIYGRPIESETSSYDYGQDHPNFNPWGTSHSPLDDQTKLTSDDLKPRELPFRFRDSRKITVKPTPRKGIPMSRVATQDRDRHQRTVTNLRSRNGTIRVIKPLETLPEIEKYHGNKKSDAFDVENIEREKTFMMLERIDRILHPNKRPARKPGSSEVEIVCSSKTSSDDTITENANPRGPSELSNARNWSPSHVISPRGRGTTGDMARPTWRRDGTGANSSKGAHQRDRRNVRFKEDPFNLKSPRTFSDVIHSLAVTEEDTDSKCQAWVDQCGDNPYGGFDE